jgi:hypothetical protein
MNLIFLHIPKTAGQSVHHYLRTNFSDNEIFPARINDQALNYSIKEIKQYSVFSGHFDISLLDIIDQPKFVFTILRKPIDRILSYYFYLRNEAKKLSPEEINSPQRQGMKAVLELSPDQYFCNQNLKIRPFIDNHYDNFYMYYFAMRSYQGRTFAQKLIKLKLMTIDDIFNKSIDTLNQLNAVYNIDNWSLLSNDLSKYFPNKIFTSEQTFINKGDGKDTEKRLDNLIKLGATQKTIDAINNFCKYDNIIYDSFINQKSNHIK